MTRSALIGKLLEGARDHTSVSSPRIPTRNFQEPRKTVQSLVESADQEGEGLTLSRSQVKELSNLLESLYDDPFQSNKSIVSTDDLEALGLKGDATKQLGFFDEGEDEKGLKNDRSIGSDTSSISRQPVLGTQVSMVAPNATPDHSQISILPDKVRNAMQAVAPDSFFEVYPGQESQRVEPDQRPQPQPQRTQTPPRPVPQRPQPTEQEPAAPSLTESISAVEAARNRRKEAKKTLKKNPRAILNESSQSEAFKAAQAKIAKLG